MRKKLLLGVSIFVILVMVVYNVAFADENEGIMLINDEIPVESESKIMPRTNEMPIEEDIMPISDEDNIVPISDEIPINENDMVSADEIKQELYLNAKNISDKNFYGFAKNITKDGEVINGNAFLCAETVELKNVTINGDVFITANRLKISKDASLNGNAFICVANVEFDGKVSREIFGAVKDIVFGENATVMYNANLVADHISVKGTFYRDINATVDNMEVKDNTVVIGNLNYVSDKEATVAKSAVITNTNFAKYEEEKKQLIDIIEDKVIDFARYFILVMLVFIATLKYLPTVIEKSKKNLSVSSFGVGILAIIVVPIILVVLLMLRVFSMAVFAMLALFVLILMISNAITNIAIAKAISEKKQNLKLPIVVAIVTVLNWLIYQIPILGGLIAFIWLTIGLGISIKNCFTKNN